MATPLAYGAFKLDMRGSIHSDEVCPVCGSKFKSFEPVGLFCPNPDHPKTSPKIYSVRFGKIHRRFNGFQEAYHFLTALRAEAGKGTFDHRDYMIGKKPFSFTALMDEWLSHKQQEIKPQSYRTLSNKVGKAQAAWGDINVKDINYGHVEDLLKAVKYSDKSKKELLAGLKSFFSWTKKRYGVVGPEDWPKLGTVQMAFRKTFSINEQEQVLEHVKQNAPYRAWLACYLLAVYISIRPSELLSVEEWQMDRERGLIIIPHPKEKRAKVVPLTSEDSELIRGVPIGMPKLKFFRHTEVKEENKPGVRRDYLGGPMLIGYLEDIWNRACEALGIDGVTLYAGTKHSTAMGLGEVATPEEIRAMTMHSTNKAFERYYRIEGKALQEMYSRRKSTIKKDQAVTKALPLKRK